MINNYSIVYIYVYMYICMYVCVLTPLWFDLIRFEIWVWLWILDFGFWILGLGVFFFWNSYRFLGRDWKRGCCCYYYYYASLCYYCRINLPQPHSPTHRTAPSSPYLPAPPTTHYPPPPSFLSLCFIIIIIMTSCPTCLY